MSEIIESTDVPHPGFFIREELEARGWSQRDLAYILDTPEQAVNMIISGKRGISSDMAKALGEAFEVNPEFFANLQKLYDMSKAKEPDPGIARRARLQNAYPVREMIKRGWLENTDAALLEIQMARFFSVSDISEVAHVQLAHAAKKSQYYEEIPPEQLAWLFRVKQIAKATPVARFSDKALRDWRDKFKRFLVDPEEARHVARGLSECGVRFVIVEGLPSCKIDGVCFWLDAASPVIGMSMRHDRIDNFWFVLAHEIEHVLQRHGMEQEVIDVDLCSDAAQAHGSVDHEEAVANSAAAEFCVSQREMASFIARKAPYFSEKDILGFARRVQVHPGIVVGQIQKRTGRWELLRKHLVKIRQYVLPSAMVDGWGHVAPISL
jgi:HTH-type transcriptional regulator / antitoxin HigA